MISILSSKAAPSKVVDGATKSREVFCLVGLSSDTKPTTSYRGILICNGSVYDEIDTGKEYLYDEAGGEWHEQPDGDKKKDDPTAEEISVSRGSADAGKVIVVGNDGKLLPVDLEVGEGQIAVDGTLKIPGAAADAKKTGDAIAALNGSLGDVKADLGNLGEIINCSVSRNYIEGKNFDLNGALVDAPNVCVSEKIPCSTWTGYARFYCNDNTITDYAICYYDTSDVLLNKFRNPSNTGSVEYRNINIDTQVTGTPSYVRFSFKKNTVGKVTNNANPPTDEKWIANEQRENGLVYTVKNNSAICQNTKILLGTDSISAETASLSANTALKLDDAPWFIMKNQGVSAMVKFSTFTSLSIGKGYMNYRGKWITIDDTYVHIYSTLDDLTGVREYDVNGKYNGQTGYAGASAHGLTISDFIYVSMYETVDGKIRINIDTLSGSFSLNIVSNYWWNYAPFIMGEQAMTSVKIGYSCSDIRSPLWMFGDSYLGFAVNRVGGQLMNVGFTNYLMDGIAGGRAVHDATPGKSISNDLNKLLSMGTPKYIIWTLGMNGTISMNTSYISTLKSLCEMKGITLILYMVPSVPNNDKTDLNTYIAGTNLRYINAYDAVGANAQGEWYNGFLSDDNIHPSILGAKAIAMRYITDVPELMQYGYITGNVDSESDDGNEI